MTSLSLGPHYRGRLGTVLHFAHYVSATYPSAKQILKHLRAHCESIVEIAFPCMSLPSGPTAIAS